MVSGLPGQCPTRGGALLGLGSSRPAQRPCSARSRDELILMGVCVSTGFGPELPTTESDTAVALALQQELGQEQVSAPDDSLEEKGLFFCQICQKNLSAMNVTRRQQHMNR